MLKRIHITIMAIIMLCWIILPISAININNKALCWENVSLINGSISFIGTNGNYSMLIDGVNGVNRITANATLYYRQQNGAWFEIPTEWSYDITDNYLSINEDFNAISGFEYKVELNAIVYKDGYGEEISKTNIKICP